MNPKFKTLEWWSICIWFLIFGTWSAIIIFGKHLIPINIMILVAGTFMMVRCAIIEDQLFPPEPQGEEET